MSYRGGQYPWNAGFLRSISRLITTQRHAFIRFRLGYSRLTTHIFRVRIKSCLRQLADYGLVENKGRGVYRFTDEGRRYIQDEGLV